MRSALGAILFLLTVTGCGVTRPPLIPPHQYRYDEYRIKPGDTLGFLSEQFGIPVGVLAALNSLPKDPRSIPEGVTLKVPFLEECYPNRAGYMAHSAPDHFAHSINRQHQRIMWPVIGGGLSSGFGYRGGSFHKGLDIPARLGTFVFAAHRGEVVYADDKLNGYGNAVIVRGEGITTLYGHNSYNLVGQGDFVEKGDLIGAVGSTGRATGNHLHFETRIHDAAVDPLTFFQPPPPLEEETGSASSLFFP